MVSICLRIPFECFQSRRMVRIWIQRLRIGIRFLQMPFERLEFAFKCFECCLKGSNLHSNALKLVRMVRSCFRLLWFPFERFKFTFECFESLSNCSMLHRMLRIPFERLEFGFACFKYCLMGLNLHSNVSNLVRVVRIGIRMLWMPVEWLEFVFECFDPFERVEFTASNPFRMLWIWMLQILFEFF